MTLPTVIKRVCDKLTSKLQGSMYHGLEVTNEPMINMFKRVYTGNPLITSVIHSKTVTNIYPTYRNA